jgi:hypothetical protein
MKRVMRPRPNDNLEYDVLLSQTPAAVNVSYLFSYTVSWQDFSKRRTDLIGDIGEVYEG